MVEKFKRAKAAISNRNNVFGPERPLQARID